MNSNKDIFVFDGKLLEYYDKGDMVSWRSNDNLKKEYGLITDFKIESIRGSNNRKYAVAEIETNVDHVVILGLGSLKLESKVHKYKNKIEDLEK